METKLEWWWISLPRATCVLGTVKGVITKTPPYFSRWHGKDVMDLIETLRHENGFRVIQLEGDHGEIYA